MGAFTPILAALALAQGEPPAVGSRSVEEAPAAAPAPAASEPRPSKDAAASPGPPASPTPPPAPDAAPAQQAPRTRKPPAAPLIPSAAPAERARSPGPAPLVPAAAPAEPARSRGAPDPEKTQVARAALAFLDALLRSDADGLAASSAERFSFDGQVETGRDAVRRTWRAVLARRDAPPASLLDLEVLPAADAVARYGPPPARVAPLAARGGWVAVANVSGRAVVLFLSRDGGRWAVAGMHD